MTDGKRMIFYLGFLRKIFSKLKLPTTYALIVKNLIFLFIKKRKKSRSQNQDFRQADITYNFHINF